MSRTWLLLRGLCRGSEHWLDFPEQLDRCFPGDRVICLDWPGNGKLFAFNSPLSIADGVEHYRRYCAARGISGPFYLVGLSMGGMAALSWKQRYPDEVSHCVVINSSAAGDCQPWQRFRPGALLRLLPVLLSVPRREQALCALTANLVGEPERVIDRWLDIARRQPVRACNFVRQLLAAQRFRLNPPVDPEHMTLIVGRGDRLVNPACSDQLSKHWGVELLEHQDAGHDLPLDAPEWLIDQLAVIASADAG